MEDQHQDSYRHVLKYTGVFGGVQGFNILMSLVRNKFVAMLLGPSGMGLASSRLVLCAISPSSMISTTMRLWSILSR